MHSASGRWQGRLTRRDLPEQDESIDALSDAQRQELSQIWLGRAASERCVADAFVAVRRALGELGSRPSLIELSERAIDDEFRHAELARLVASRFAGRELDAPPPIELRIPQHQGASPKLRHTLHILGQCAMNETFASSFLEATLAMTEAPFARAAVQELLADEIDHARIGWAHLASLKASERAELAPWLLGLVRGNLEMWRRTPRPYPVDPELHRQGAPSSHTVEATLLAAVGELIVPGLEHFELPTTEIRMWLAAGAPTRTALVQV